MRVVPRKVTVCVFVYSIKSLSLCARGSVAATETQNEHDRIKSTDRDGLKTETESETNLCGYDNCFSSPRSGFLDDGVTAHGFAQCDCAVLPPPLLIVGLPVGFSSCNKTTKGGESEDVGTKAQVRCFTAIKKPEFSGQTHCLDKIGLCSTVGLVHHFMVKRIYYPKKSSLSFLMVRVLHGCKPL